MNLNDKKAIAIEAVNDMHQTSGWSLEEVLEALEEVAEYVDELCGAIREDIGRRDVGLGGVNST